MLSEDMILKCTCDKCCKTSLMFSYIKIKYYEFKNDLDDSRGVMTSSRTFNHMPGLLTGPYGFTRNRPDWTFQLH